MKPERVLNLGRSNVLAARNVDVFEAVHNAVPALSVTLRQVTRAQPLPAHRPRGGLGIAQVAGENARSAHPQLTGGLALQRQSRLDIGDAHLDMRILTPDRADMRGGLGSRQSFFETRMMRAFHRWKGLSDLKPDSDSLNMGTVVRGVKRCPTCGGGRYPVGT